MIQRPLVGILCCTNPVGHEAAHTVIDRYVAAVEQCLPADVVLLPTSIARRGPATLLRRLDGVVLTGSPSNVEARHYDGVTTPGPFDAARDAAAFAVVRTATVTGIPVLGICRGLQEINVAFGGTLRAGLGGVDRALAHHAPDEAADEALFDWWHPVDLPEAGLLRGKLGCAQARVNSVHFQGVARLGQGLRAEAWAPDGQIEALSAEGRPVFAVQWHPEQDPSEPTSRAVFEVFADMLANRHK